MIGQPFERLALPTAANGYATRLRKYAVEARGVGLAVIRCPGALNAAVRFDTAAADPVPIGEGDVFWFDSPFASLFIDSDGLDATDQDQLELLVIQEGMRYFPGRLPGVREGRDLLATGALGRQLQPSELAVTPGAAVYAIGDSVGGLLTFDNAARKPSGAVELLNVVVTDAAAAKPDLDLILFNGYPSLSVFLGGITDAAAVTINQVDRRRIMARVRIAAADYADVSAGLSVANVELHQVLQLQENETAAYATSIFGVLRAVSAPTYNMADDLGLKLGIRQL